MIRRPIKALTTTLFLCALMFTAGHAQILEFDAAKTQLTFKRGGREVLFTKEN